MFWKVATGFPNRTCAKSKKPKRITIQLNRDARRSAWAGSFPQAGARDDRRPSLVLIVDVTAELFRRAADPRDGLRLQGLPNLVRLERLVGGARELVDDRLRRARRRDQSEPQDRLEARDPGLDHGGKIGNDRAALGVGDGEQIGRASC